MFRTQGYRLHDEVRRRFGFSGEPRGTGSLDEPVLIPATLYPFGCISRLSLPHSKKLKATAKRAFTDITLHSANWHRQLTGQTLCGLARELNGENSALQIRPLHGLFETKISARAASGKERITNRLLLAG